MTNLNVQNRPFATEIIAGLMLPDGIFDTIFGTQFINAHVSNLDAVDSASNNVYIEGVSHPGIVVTPMTHFLGALAAGASRVVNWQADFSNCPPGVHMVSIVMEGAGGIVQRAIKKIFVTRTHFDTATTTFTIATPEGTLSAKFADLIGPAIDPCKDPDGGKGGCNCCCKPCTCGEHDSREAEMSRHLAVPKNLSFAEFTSFRAVEKTYGINDFAELFTGHDAEFRFCPPGYLPNQIDAVWTPLPPYAGQYGDLPFQDPWWKVLLCIIAVILLIAAAIYEATEGSGSVGVSGGSGGGSGSGGDDDCCGVSATGGGSSYVAAGLVAAAATAATIAAASDDRDIFRRGQDATPPAAGEITTAEHVQARFKYLEPVALGRPFKIGLDWDYRRVTTGQNYNHSASDIQTNIHVLSEYKITAPENFYVYKKDLWIVNAEFKDENGERLHGNQLFVQCFLVGPNGEWDKIILQDDGVFPDEKPNNGVYTGVYGFNRNQPGLWTYYVIAQDVNHAQPDMSPEEAAQIIGGMVVTHQLVIDFDSDDCPFVPDGHVLVHV